MFLTIVCSQPGLKLKLQDQQLPTTCYTYALPPLMDKPIPVNWKIIVNNDVHSQHVGCHALHPGDNAKELVATFRRALAKAVVLVNTQDNYTLAPEFTEGVDKSNYPTIVLTKSDGASLVELLERYYGQTDVLARLDVEGIAVELQQEQAGLEQSTEGSNQQKKDGKRSDSHGMVPL